MRKCALLILSMLLAGASSTASAATINIRFDLTQSWVSLLGGVIVTPPDGYVGQGKGIVSVAGAGIATPSAGGAATIHQMKMRFNVKAFLASALVKGYVAADLTNDPTGTLTGGGSAIAFGGPGVFYDDGSLTCTGANCGFLAAFPVTSHGAQTYSPLGTIPISGLSTIGAAAFSKAFAFSISGYTGVLNVVGQEISRDYTEFPEPEAVTLLGSGLIALAWLRLRRKPQAQND